MLSVAGGLVSVCVAGLLSWLRVVAGGVRVSAGLSDSVRVASWSLCTDSPRPVVLRVSLVSVAFLAAASCAASLLMALPSLEGASLLSTAPFDTDSASLPERTEPSRGWSTDILPDEEALSSIAIDC